jgi:hypothetical protein
MAVVECLVEVDPVEQAVDEVWDEVEVLAEGVPEAGAEQSVVEPKRHRTAHLETELPMVVEKGNDLETQQHRS